MTDKAEVHLIKGWKVCQKKKKAKQNTAGEPTFTVCSNKKTKKAHEVTWANVQHRRNNNSEFLM